MKRAIAAMAATMMTIALAGCGGSKEETAPVKSDSGEETADVSTSESSASDETICIYTNNASDGRAEWFTEKAAEAGYDILVVDVGASDATNRVLAERNNPLCDVLFGLNNIEYEKLKAADCLEKWEPDWVETVDQNLIDKDGYYYPVSTTPLLLIGNADYADMPSDWTDLIQDKYKGLYQLHGLGGGTGKTVYASIVSRYKDPEGELGISEEGWEIAKAFIGNAHDIAEGADAIGDVIDGTYPMDEHWASGVLTEQKNRGYKFQIMTPEVGEPFVVESLAIVKGTDKYDLCVEFCNWLGGSEMQLEWSNNFGTIPCQQEALENVSDDIKELVAVLKPQELDWAFIAENVDAWVEKAELEFMQ